MISDEVWREHIEADRKQDTAIRSLHLAVFGDEEKPETVKQAIAPTMARINAWLDAIKFLGQMALGACVALGALAGAAKAMGLL